MSYDGGMKELDIVSNIDREIKEHLIFKKSIEQSLIEEVSAEEHFTDSRRVHNFNEEIFSEIDTIEKAYWLGLLYADGYNNERINALFLSLQRKDKNHIEKFCDFLGYDRSQIKDIEIVSKLTNKIYYASRIVTNSKKLSSDLKLKGCPQAKSLILSFPRWLNPDFYSHFMRGYYDGDGSLNLNTSNNEWKLSVAGTADVLNHFQEIWKKLSINSFEKNISKTENNTWELVISGNEQIKRASDWLWKDSRVDIRLDRKFNKYNQLIKQQNSRKALTKKQRDTYFISQNIKNIILEKMKNDISYDEIIEEYKVPRATLSRLKENAGLKRNARKSKFRYDETMFDILDTDEKIKWWKFIIANARIAGNGIVIRLDLARSWELENIIDFIYKQNKPPLKKTRDSCSIEINSKYLVGKIKNEREMLKLK